MSLKGSGRRLGAADYNRQSHVLPSVLATDVIEMSNGMQSGPRIGIQKGPLFGIGSGLSR